MTLNPDNRSVSPVVGTVFMVAIVVVIAATVGVSMFGFSDDLRDLTAPMTYGENLIENPGFEDGAAHWRNDLKANGGELVVDKIAPNEGIDGSNALQVDGDEGYAGQELDAVLLPDAEYRLCAQSRLESEDSGRAWIGVQHDTGGEDIQLVSWEVTWDEYRNQCEYFKADRELEDITVWVYTDGGDASVFTDDFVLQRTQYLTDAR